MFWYFRDSKKLYKSVLFHGDTIKTWTLKKTSEKIESDKKYKMYFPTMSCKRNQGIAIDTKLTWHDSLTFMKQFFGGNKIDENYNGLKNQDKKIISLVGNFVKN